MGDTDALLQVLHGGGNSITKGVTGVNNERENFAKEMPEAKTGKVLVRFLVHAFYVKSSFNNKKLPNISSVFFLLYIINVSQFFRLFFSSFFNESVSFIE